MSDQHVEGGETLPIEAVAAGVAGLRILFTNVYAIAGSDGWILVDAGLQGSAGRIERWAQGQFGGGPPKAIVLTHGHFDHVGALPSLLDSWPVPVYAHPLELPYITGQQAYPPPDPSVGGGLMSRMSVLYPRGPFDLHGHVRALPDDGRIPGLSDWTWVATPGHTAGHVSLFRATDRTLVVGDAFCTVRAESFLAVATQKPELHGPPAYFTTDWDAAADSVRRLAALEPARIAPGHGQPMSGPDMRRALHTIADRFDQLARPEHGRYVERPVR
jgi:glyoxylase-like metal-dependent hydrolase (beta-lactamase superfamily II)